MRNLFLYSTSLLLYSLLVTTPLSSQIRKIYLNPKSAGKEKQSSLIDSIRFIPFEIMDDVELDQYNGFYISDTYYLIIDYDGQNVFLYSKMGDFVRTISYKKLGKEFHAFYEEKSNQLVFFGDNKNYDLTEKDYLKIRLGWDQPRNRKYFRKYTIDLGDPSFVLKKALPRKEDITEAHHFYGDHYLQSFIITSPLFKDSLAYELELIKGDQVLKRFFPYDRIREPRYLFTEKSVGFHGSNAPFTETITRPYCDTVYKLVKDSLYPYCQVVLPLENAVPPALFTKPFRNKTDRENFEENNGSMFQHFSKFHETSRFIHVGVSYYRRYESYIYQKQTGVTYKVTNVIADSSQYNLQLLENYGTKSSGGKFYILKRAGDLISFFEAHKGVPVPKELEAYLNAKPKPDAPVLVEYQFKN